MIIKVLIGLLIGSSMSLISIRASASEDFGDAHVTEAGYTRGYTTSRTVVVTSHAVVTPRATYNYHAYSHPAYPTYARPGYYGGHYATPVWRSPPAYGWRASAYGWRYGSPGWRPGYGYWHAPLWYAPGYGHWQSWYWRTNAFWAGGYIAGLGFVAAGTYGWPYAYFSAYPWMAYPLVSWQTTAGVCAAQNSAGQIFEATALDTFNAQLSAYNACVAGSPGQSCSIINCGVN